MTEEDKNTKQMNGGEIATSNKNQQETGQNSQTELGRLKVELNETKGALQKTANAVKDIASEAEKLAKSAAHTIETTGEEISVLSDKNNRTGFLIGVGGALIIASVVFCVFIFNSSIGLGVLNASEDSKIFANAVRIGLPSQKNAAGYMQQEWLIQGTFLKDGVGDKPPEVFLVMTDTNGNRFTGSSKKPDSMNKVENKVKGGHVDWNFSIPVTQWFSGTKRPNVKNIVVSATATKYYLPNKVLTTLSPDKSGIHWSKASGKPFIGAMILFSVAFILSLWQTCDQLTLRTTYYATVVIALAFTVAMIVFISKASQELAGPKDDGAVISLGFAHVFFGTYVSNSEPEWLLSLTTPPTAKKTGNPRSDTGNQSSESPVENFKLTKKEETMAEAPGTKGTKNTSASATTNIAKEITGFGAPLWLILLAVVGSAVFMIKLLVDSLKAPINFSHKIIRERMAEIVRYQVYIFFAPLGAIFVYQLLVAAGSASEPITLGITALAAGIGLNTLLEKAWKGTESALNT